MGLSTPMESQVAEKTPTLIMREAKMDKQKQNLVMIQEKYLKDMYNRKTRLSSKGITRA